MPAGERALDGMEDEFDQDPELVKLADEWQKKGKKKADAADAFKDINRRFIEAIREKEESTVRILNNGNWVEYGVDADWKIKKKKIKKAGD